jgi:hypothetical protein
MQVGLGSVCRRGRGLPNESVRGGGVLWRLSKPRIRKIRTAVNNTPIPRYVQTTVDLWMLTLPTWIKSCKIKGQVVPVPMYHSKNTHSSSLHKMDESGQLHAPAGLHGGKNTRYPMDRSPGEPPRAGLAAVARRNMSSLYRESNSGRPAHSLVISLTELPWIKGPRVPIG